MFWVLCSDETDDALGTERASLAGDPEEESCTVDEEESDLDSLAEDRETVESVRSAAERRDATDDDADNAGGGVSLSGGHFLSSPLEEQEGGGWT